jgi:hypothetical protein
MIFQSTSKRVFTLKTMKKAIGANASKLGIITKTAKEANKLLNFSTYIEANSGITSDTVVSTRTTRP